MPHKGRKPAGAKGPKEQCDKKTAGAAKPADKKTPDTAERKPGGTSASTTARATASGASAGASAASTKVPASQERTMKPADTKAKQTAKSVPGKSTQTTKPKTTTAPSPSTTSTAKPSTGKTPTKQDAKPEPEKQKDSKVSPSSAGKAAAATVGAAAVSAAVVGSAAAGAAAAGAASSKPKEEVKRAKKVEDKKAEKVEAKKAVSADKTAAEPSKSEQDQALDSLIDTLGGPEEGPPSPEFTGPEITESPISSEHLEALGKRETTLPPKYRHLLDGKGEKTSVPEPKPADEGKGEKPEIPPPKAAAEEGFGDDDLLEALSSNLVSSPAPPEQEKPKLEEKKQAQVAAAPSASSQPAPTALSEEALDELLGSLAAPPTNEPESPQFTGPIVTENITATHINYKPGDLDITLPPKYRGLLDGKDHGKPIPPPTEQPEPSMSDADLVDEFSKDFECSLSPAAETPAPLAAAAAAGKPKDTTKDKQATADVVVPSAASTVKAAAPPSTAAPSASVDDALDALMDTLEGPEFSAPESPQYTGPIITETRVATHIEELGKKESTLPPKYRHLLDGKSDGKTAPPPPEEQPLSEGDLLDELDKDFACPQSPAAQPTPATKPQDAPVKKAAEPEAVVSAASASAVQASKAVTCKAPPKVDPLDALASTLGTRQEDPKDKKPVADKVKEKTGKEHRDKLGEDEETIPPEYRLKEVKDKDGKPLLPKPEEKPKSLSESDLLDELDFASPQSPAVKPAPATKPQDSTKKATEPEAVVSAASASAVHAAPSKAATSKAPPKADPLDALAGTLGTRQEDPKDKKPVADKVKEKTGKEHRDKLGEDEETIPPEYRLKEVKDKDGKPLLPKPEEKPKELSEDDLLDALTEGFVTSPTVAQCAPLQASAKVSGMSGSEEVVSCSKASSVQSGAPQSPANSGAQIPDDALDLLSGSLGTRQEDPDDKKPIVDVVKEKVKEKHIEKLGDRDDTIPPEYRHLLDGKDQGKPAKPEEVKPEKSLDENSAIDALSSGLASCDTGSTDKAKSSAKDKTEKSVSSAPAVKPTEKTADASKSTSQSSSTKPSAPPSAPKTGRS
ncbi:calpastatin [Hyperolius riggenbachi]|uniref:calpastatin n=1 Tax=Hyperolius riggenbachi TaxID=752182 RepID=UPI0035A37A44